MNNELRERAYGISSLPEKTRGSNHFQMQLQKQHFPLSHLKNLSAGPARVQNHDNPYGSSILDQLS